MCATGFPGKVCEWLMLLSVAVLFITDGWNWSNVFPRCKDQGQTSKRIYRLFKLNWDGLAAIRDEFEMSWQRIQSYSKWFIGNAERMRDELGRKSMTCRFWKRIGKEYFVVTAARGPQVSESPSRANVWTSSACCTSVLCYQPSMMECLQPSVRSVLGVQCVQVLQVQCVQCWAFSACSALRSSNLYDRSNTIEYGNAQDHKYVWATKVLRMEVYPCCVGKSCRCKCPCCV